MRIALDGRSISEEMVGVGHYVAHLVSYLLNAGHSCVLFVGEEKKIPAFPHSERLRLVKVPGDTDHTPERERTEQQLFPHILLQHSVDLFHATDNCGIPEMDVPSVLTIHDIIPLRLPGELSAKQRGIYRNTLATSIHRAHAILTVSTYSKKEIVHEFSLRPHRVHVTYDGYQIADAAHVSETDFPFTIPEQYILYVGGLSRRKNIFNTLRAYAQLIEHDPDGPAFILVGKLKSHMRDEYASWQQYIKERNLQNKVIFTGYITDQELAFLRSRALCAVYLSLYEGFGLPIIEAMAQGVPIVTSNRTATKEVAGNAALLVDPEDITAMCHAMSRLVNEKKLRAQLIAKGKKRCQHFSWEKTAAQTLSIYQKLLQ